MTTPKEKERLAAVKKFQKLHLDSDDYLHDILFLAAEICRTNSAMISFVGDTDQCFVVKKGLDLNGTPIEAAFCNHTIQQDNLLEVPDSLLDSRFRLNPLVTGNPHIRFYAGATLKTNDDHNIGSLCVIDQEPRKLSDNQQKALLMLSRKVSRRIELNARVKDYEEIQNKFAKQKQLFEKAETTIKAFYNSTDEFYLLLNNKLEVIAFNRAVKDFFEQQAPEFEIQEGVSFLNCVIPSLLPKVRMILQDALQGKEVKNESLIDLSIDNFWLRYNISPVYNDETEIIGIACIGSNKNLEKHQEEKIKAQKNTLSEIAQLYSHQVRSPLTNILGLVDLMKRDSIETSSPYLQMLDSAAHDLDSVIRDIVYQSWQQQ
jgi:GAF domain-containing protein